MRMVRPAKKLGRKYHACRRHRSLPQPLRKSRRPSRVQRQLAKDCTRPQQKTSVSRLLQPFFEAQDLKIVVTQVSRKCNLRTATREAAMAAFAKSWRRE